MSGVSHSSLLTPQQAADKFGVTAKTIHRWVTAGKLPGVRLPSGRIRVPADAVIVTDVEVAS